MCHIFQHGCASMEQWRHEGTRHISALAAKTSQCSKSRIYRIAIIVPEAATAASVMRRTKAARSSSARNACCAACRAKRCTSTSEAWEGMMRGAAVNGQEASLRVKTDLWASVCAVRPHSCNSRTVTVHLVSPAVLKNLMHYWPQIRQSSHDTQQSPAPN
jgi:hypothetical protein